VIAIAAVLAVVLFGAGAGTAIALSGGQPGSGAASSNAGSVGALRLPGKFLGLDRNTDARVSSSGFPAALVAHYVSGVYGADLPHTPTVAVVGGRLTRAGQSEAHIAPAVMALDAVQFRGSTDAQNFPAGHADAGIACTNFSEPTLGMAIACFSVDQTTLLHAIYIGGAASSLQDAAAKTIQIRQELER
jgi:hypothetical protein